MSTSLAVPRLGAVYMSSNQIESQRSIPLLDQVMIAKNSSTLRQRYRGDNIFEQDIIARPYIASSEMTPTDREHGVLGKEGFGEGRTERAR